MAHGHEKSLAAVRQREHRVSLDDEVISAPIQGVPRRNVETTMRRITGCLNADAEAMDDPESMQFTVAAP